MNIHTLWKTWDDDSLELLFALDEYTVEQNWDAWQEGCKAARERYGIQEVDTREVIVSVPHKAILDAFMVPEVYGRIVLEDRS